MGMKITACAGARDTDVSRLGGGAVSDFSNVRTQFGTLKMNPSVLMLGAAPMLDLHPCIITGSGNMIKRKGIPFFLGFTEDSISARILPLGLRDFFDEFPKANLYTSSKEDLWLTSVYIFSLLKIFASLIYKRAFWICSLEWALCFAISHYISDYIDKKSTR